MGKRWRIYPHDVERVTRLERAAQIPPVVAQLLLSRGIHDPRVATTFLAARLSELRDPVLLPGLTTAAERIGDALQAKRKITIYGDYDADGMTATAILLRCLRILGGHAKYYVPNRLDEGYGLNRTALEKIAADGTDLVVTVDCGIGSVAEAEAARELGLELIITDHHELSTRLPPAAAVVHPRLPGSDYPFAGLCGAGIAFKLAWELCRRASAGARVSPPCREFLLAAMGLAAIGTVADVVPLVDENRLLVRHGLGSLREHAVPGVAALSLVTGLDRKPALSSEDIAFTMAPRLNAAGRLGQAELAVELLVTDSEQRARGLAEFLQELNSNRDHVQRCIYLAARKQLTEQFDVTSAPALVLAQRGWHAGVIGIVAGRLAEKFSRPCILIALDELSHAHGTGSARSALGLNLHTALQACATHLVTFGGHAAAAGLRIEERNIPPFRQDFCEHVAGVIPPEDRLAELHIDAESPLSQLTLRTVGQIEQLAPFGQSNPRPLLCATDVRLEGPPRTMGGGDRHLSLRLNQHNVTLRAVAFGQAEWLEDLGGRDRIDIVYRPVINDYRGRRSVELHMVDWRPAKTTTCRS